MRDTVCIVLNEREPRKHQAASDLIKALGDSGITASRLEIDRNIEKKIVEWNPQILVLDYLLGDFSTGLDVLARISEIEEDARPAIYFLTDEPSIQVAVDALKMGVRDYLEIDHPQSISKLVASIKEQVNLLQLEKLTVSRSRRIAPRIRSARDLVCHSKSARKLLDALNSCTASAPPIVIVQGPEGSGRSTIADLFLASKKPCTPLREINLQWCSEELNEACGVRAHSSKRKLGIDLSVLIENGQFDNGDLFELIQRNFAALWGKNPVAQQASCLVLSTNSELQAKMWSKISPSVQILHVPSLAERIEDIAQLAQHFALEAQELAGIKAIGITPSDAEWFAAQKWPGQMRQLRAVVGQTVLLTGRDSEKRSLQEIAQQAIEIWSESEASAAPPYGVRHEDTNGNLIEPSSLSREVLLALNLQLFSGNLRAAAAALGCSVREVQSFAAKFGQNNNILV